jgi:hypothetical protein
LVLIRTVADFAEPIEEHCATERVLLLAFIEADVAAAPQFWVLQPIQREQGSLELAELAQCLSESVLPRIAASLRRMTDAVTVPVLIDISNRKMSCQWSWICFILTWPATKNSSSGGTFTPGME